MANQAEIARDACDQLAGYLPELERLTPEPDDAAFAVPGMTGRPAASPLPGNAQALYALTGIHATARQIEAILKYAAGARRPGPLVTRGGSEGNTLRALDAIPGLVAVVDHDLFRMVIGELERRLNDARSIPAIDEAQQWRRLRGRPCPYCGCYFLETLLDRSGRSTGHIECHAVGCRDGNLSRPAAGIGTDEHGRPVLAWADGLTETASDLEA